MFISPLYIYAQVLSVTDYCYIVLHNRYGVNRYVRLIKYTIPVKGIWLKWYI